MKSPRLCRGIFTVLTDSVNYDKLIIRLAKTNLCNFIMEEYMGEVIRGILIPFLGTTLGASCVLFMKKMMNKMVQRALTG